MTIKEQIIAEIERLMKWKPKAIPSGMRQRNVLNIRKGMLLTLKDFINSLPAEQTAERLGDEIDNFSCSDEFALAKRAGEEIIVTAQHFAQWQKQRIIDKACEWLRLNTLEYFDDAGVDMSTFVENFFTAMKKEDE